MSSDTGLAVIAGTPSSGIKLDSQDIINKFGSGLALFLEKPIRPGDNFFVDGIGEANTIN